MEIGVRELRDGLSRHLAFVREGRTITVTDHGKPVARLVPVGVPTRLEQLKADGRISPARRRKSGPPAPLVVAGPVSDLISEQRR